MRRALLASLALAALVAGAARADSVGFTSGSSLPSPETPNAPGSIVVPSPLSRPPAAPEQRSYDQLLALWQRAGQTYGVPWQVLGAINKVESNFGRNTGPSSAGAVGWMQFMPSTWMRWGLDANGDGVADPWNPDDAVYAAARYLAAAGGRSDIARAVFAYNHAQWYVDEVLALARLFGGGRDAGFAAQLTAGVGSPQMFFEVDNLAHRLADARRRVVRAQRAVGDLEQRIERLGWRKIELEQRAGDPSLSDAAFRRVEARITRVSVLADRLRRHIETRRNALDYAVSALDELKREQAAASVAPAAAQVLNGAAQATSSSYVFPVGGGPGVVSVAHTHHDYPAADIAAPEGSPVYALNDGTVVEAYRDGSGRCGIGFRLQLTAGPTYVYCHLAYMEPDVVPGAAVASGAQVGLVGHTGHATGPHLHLQFSPPTSYPQNEAWFRSFAGKAFRWQDAPTPEGDSGEGPVVGFTTETSTTVGFTP